MFPESTPAKSTTGSSSKTKDATKDTATDEEEPKPVGTYQVTRNGRMTLKFDKPKDTDAAASASQSGQVIKSGSGAKPTAASPKKKVLPQGVMTLFLRQDRSGIYWSGDFREQGGSGRTLRNWEIRVNVVNAPTS